MYECPRLTVQDNNIWISYYKLLYIFYSHTMCSSLHDHLCQVTPHNNSNLTVCRMEIPQKIWTVFRQNCLKWLFEIHLHIFPSSWVFYHEPKTHNWTNLREFHFTDLWPYKSLGWELTYSITTMTQTLKCCHRTLQFWKFISNSSLERSLHTTFNVAYHKLNVINIVFFKSTSMLCRILNVFQ